MMRLMNKFIVKWMIQIIVRMIHDLLKKEWRMKNCEMNDSRLTVRMTMLMIQIIERWMIQDSLWDEWFKIDNDKVIYVLL
jgi:hypothetical protein